MLQRLPLVFEQVKAGSTSVNLLNEIHQIICSLYRAKEITKNVYNNKMNSIKILYLWILKIVKHLILADHYSTFQMKWTKRQMIKYYTWKNIKKSHKNNK